MKEERKLVLITWSEVKLKIFANAEQCIVKLEVEKAFKKLKAEKLFGLVTVFFEAEWI